MDWGGGEIFSLRCTMGWTIIFFELFQKKLSLCTMGKIDFFWKLNFQWDGGSFFFVFFSKKVVIIYYGENTLFLKIRFAMGWTIIFFGNKIFKMCRYVLWGKYVFSLEWNFQWVEWTVFVSFSLSDIESFQRHKWYIFQKYSYFLLLKYGT